ncbi:MAG TPA: penicillin acylase family protein [Gammaproteobacteria bacterium]|nr:penicillin acylase family protein [Gammaproteobacteria bacterium]
MTKRLSAAALLVALALALGAYGLLTASLPRRTGEAPVAGLAAPTPIDLDARAIPTIHAASFVDALRGQGYMHAQERFFEMDLMRRAPAGELAGLFGERALAADLAQRPFEFRERARAVLAELPPEQIAWLDAYTAGVNAGLADLRSRPPEYWLFGARPEPWTNEDSLLVVFAFYTMLSNNDSFERTQGVLRATVAPAVYDFLTPSTSRFDRPLVGASDGDPTGGYAPLPVPDAATLDLRTSAQPASGAIWRVDPPLLGAASNQWAVDASRGTGGRALLANDPHLGLRVPSLFYRSELDWPGHIVRGVGVPGLPGILLGANGALAWGATVSNADQTDWVVVDVDPTDANRYRTPEGFEAFTTRKLAIAVAGREPHALTVQGTRWGPVVAHDWRGRPLALHATWLMPHGVNLAVLGLAEAASIADGLDTIERWAGPSINWMLADADGGIGWIVSGPLPRRVGFDGSRPESWADGSRAWDGLLAPPKLVGGRDGALFTANNRTLPPDVAATLSRMWMRPLRAQRIAELLDARRTFTPRDFLAMQLDTRAEGYEQLRAAVLAAVPADEQDALLARARRYVQSWNGRADVDQPGFRLLHAYYRRLLERALSPLLAPAIAADPTYVYRWPLADEALRRLLDERPPHLLTREYADWPDFLRQVFAETVRAIDGTRAGIDATWGEINALDVAHPFAGLGALAPLKRWLALPVAELPGSMVSLRVAAPGYGAVIRMAVSPAAPQDGILEMAGGQSGHFLSPQFRDQEQDWIDGAPSPFVAGPAVTRIVLTPPR